VSENSRVDVERMDSSSGSDGSDVEKSVAPSSARFQHGAANYLYLIFE
jgi:hypothetical protein